MADEGGVSVGLHAFMPGHTRRGRGQVWSVVSPTPRVGGGPEGDGDVVAQQVDDMGLRGVGGRHERGNVLVCVGHVGGPLMQARAVGVDRRGHVVQDLARGWSLPRVIAVPLPCKVRTHEWQGFGPIRQRHCVQCVAIALIVLGRVQLSVYPSFCLKGLMHDE